jgi:transposase
VVRYADGGGTGPAARAKREQIRLRAATMFEREALPVEVARVLEVSEKSARAWRRAWADGGTGALASTGPPGPKTKLDQRQITRLEQALPDGPAAAGWAEDQRWTLARVATLIGRMFHASYSLKGVALLLHRLGWTPQVPVHRTAERDDDAVATWRKTTWPQVNGSRAGRCVDLLRRRSRTNAETSQGPHLGPAWAYTRGQGDGQGLGPDLDRGHDLLQGRREITADLPDDGAPRS